MQLKICTWQPRPWNNTRTTKKKKDKAKKVESNILGPLFIKFPILSFSWLSQNILSQYKHRINTWLPYWNALMMIPLYKGGWEFLVKKITSRNWTLNKTLHRWESDLIETVTYWNCLIRHQGIIMILLSIIYQLLISGFLLGQYGEFLIICLKF